MATNVTVLFENIEISSGKVGEKNPPQATEMWQPHQEASGACSRKKNKVKVTT